MPALNRGFASLTAQSHRHVGKRLTLYEAESTEEKTTRQTRGCVRKGKKPESEASFKERVRLAGEAAGPRSLNSALFNTALAYATAADLSWGQIEPTKNADFAAPAVMSQAFAVELILKFFLVIDEPDASFDELKAAGVNLRGHKYTELFDRIAEPYQQKIAVSFSKVAGRRPEIAKFREALVQLGDDPFVQWRYAYEREGLFLNVELLRKVLLALGKAAEAERKRIVANKREGLAP